MIIDSHAHVLLPEAAQLALMDAAGVDRTVLFMTTVHPEKAPDPGAFRKEMATLQAILSGRVNAGEVRARALAEHLEVLRHHPDRYVGFGSVPVGLSEAETRSRVAGAVAEGLVGLGEFTLAPGQVALLEPVFAAAADYTRLPLWVHTFEPFTRADLHGLAALADRYPRVPVILGHLGGVHWLDAIELAAERPQVYLDLSAAFTVMAPRLAIQALPERTLFSSDAPYGDPVLGRHLVERVAPDAGVRRRVLGENIAELLGL